METLKWVGWGGIMVCLVVLTVLLGGCGAIRDLPRYW